MSRLVGALTVAVVVLATIYAFNRFSGKNVSDLGRASTAAA